MSVTIDMSYLNELSNGNPKYIYDVIGIFLDNTPKGFEELKVMVSSGDDWKGVSAQAHFLKSSLSVITVKTMYENLLFIEHVAKGVVGEKDKNDIIERLGNINIEMADVVEQLKEKRKFYKSQVKK